MEIYGIDANTDSNGQLCVEGQMLIAIDLLLLFIVCYSFHKNLIIYNACIRFKSTIFLSFFFSLIFFLSYYNFIVAVVKIWSFFYF